MVLHTSKGAQPGGDNDRPSAQAGPGSPEIMGVINRTTDSFYASAVTLEAAIDAVARSHPNVLISVDTWRSEVAEAACAAGAGLLNDTWAGADPNVAVVAARHQVGIVCFHTGGLPPRTDAHRNRYGLHSGEVVDSALVGLMELAHKAVEAGVPAEQIIIDPTPDFGKNTFHSLRLLRDLERFVETGFPVLLAISRKDFVGETIGEVAPEDRLHGTIAGTTDPAHTVRGLR